MPRARWTRRANAGGYDRAKKGYQPRENDRPKTPPQGGSGVVVPQQQPTRQAEWNAGQAREA